jgi:hypothetical protein
MIVRVDHTVPGTGVVHMSIPLVEPIASRSRHLNYAGAL